MKAADSPTVAHKDLNAQLRSQLENGQAEESYDSRLEPPASSRIGKVLDGRYRVNELLGVGGMGTVYLAQDLELDDKVALKLLRRDVIDVPGAVERFRREVKLARRVTHPNVSRTYDIASHGDDLFITMEPLAGNTLARVSKGPQLQDQAIAQIGLQICAGLNAAHRAGVVHRDLKPQNVMLEPPELGASRVVIMDFGIAQSNKLEHDGATGLGQVVGTPAYMAPEQLSGKAVDHRADLCSLGIVLFELFTGVLPWRGETPSATALARLRMDAPDPRDFRKDLPAALAEVTLHCLARSPEDRPSSAANVAMELKAWLRTTDSHPSRPLIWLPPSPGDERPTLTSHGLSQAHAALQPHAVDYEALSRPTPSGPASPRPTSAAPSSRPHAARDAGPSIAVVPHQPFESSEACGLLEELCEEVVGQLSITPGLRVRSLGSVVSLQREHPTWDAERLGRALGVDFVIEAGASSVSGECVLRTRLLDVDHDVQLWADRLRAGRSATIEACEQAARTAVTALTRRTFEDPEFHTWLDGEPDSSVSDPADAGGDAAGNSLPHGNSEGREGAPQDADDEASASAERGSSSESSTRGGRVLCASA